MTAEEGVRLYAHRGACLRCPENSLEAFRTALEAGADALEMDVHRTADGYFVVAHDPDGARLYDDPRTISTLNLEAVRRWRTAGGSAPPTLEETLEAFPDTPMSIDLKPKKTDPVRSFLGVLERYGARDRVTVASFHHTVMLEVHRLGWSGRTALSRREVARLRFLPEPLAHRMIRGRSAQIPRSAGPLKLDRPSFIRRCRRMGLRVDYWVVNDPEEALELLERGATGIMTDDPERLAPVVTRFRQRAGTGPF